jgi:hypothetical protein
MLKGMTPSFCHGCGHYECVCVMDSTGKPIRVGDTVRFRGKNHTIKEFIRKAGSPARITFNEPHMGEPADETTVDFVGRPQCRIPT